MQKIHWTSLIAAQQFHGRRTLHIFLRWNVPSRFGTEVDFQGLACIYLNGRALKCRYIFWLFLLVFENLCPFPSIPQYWSWSFWQSFGTFCNQLNKHGPFKMPYFIAIAELRCQYFEIYCCLSYHMNGALINMFCPKGPLFQACIHCSRFCCCCCVHPILCRSIHAEQS